MDAVLTSPLVRTLTVAIPALVGAVFLGSVIGESGPLIGLFILGVCLALVLASALGQRGLLEGGILAFLLFGYLVGNRGFAEQALIRPFFVGEVGLAILTLLVGSRFLLKRDVIVVNHPLMWAVLAYLAYAAIRFLFDVGEYKIQAVRDLAIVYYSLFFFIAYQLGSKPRARLFLEKALALSFVGHAIIVIVLNSFPNLLSQHFVMNGAPLFYQKSDLTATFSAVGLIFIGSRPRLFGLKWLRVLVLLILALSIGVSAARAALFGLFFGGLLFWRSGQRRLFAYSFVGLFLGIITFLFVVASGSSLNHLEQVVVFKEKVASMMDINGNYNYETDFGEQKNDNNEFRRAFWKVMIEETTRSNPAFGKGFGYDFLPRFEAYYNRGGWEGLRSPHNYFITVYGRMGLVGLLIFSMLTFAAVRSGWAAANLVVVGRIRPVDFSYWCGAIVLLASASVGVVLEGPMGAIPFWTLLGLALSSPVLPPKTLPAADAPAEQHQRRRSFVRPPAALGALARRPS